MSNALVVCLSNGVLGTFFVLTIASGRQGIFQLRLSHLSLVVWNLPASTPLSPLWSCFLLLAHAAPLPLDQDARFHPDGVPSRACDLCWHAFHRWEETRGERLTKIQSVIDAQHYSGSDASTDSDGSEVSQDEAPKATLTPPSAQGGEIAASIPRGWNWSTF